MVSQDVVGNEEFVTDWWFMQARLVVLFLVFVCLITVFSHQFVLGVVPSGVEFPSIFAWVLSFVWGVMVGRLLTAVIGYFVLSYYFDL